jgi:hypothetical protein
MFETLCIRHLKSVSHRACIAILPGWIRRIAESSTTPQGACCTGEGWQAIRMHDPLEDVTSFGTIETWASKGRVSTLLQPVLDAASAQSELSSRRSMSEGAADRTCR